MRRVQSPPPMPERSCPQPAPSSSNAQGKRAPPLPAVAAVLENPDLVAVVLAHAELGPREFVSVGRVGKAWHAARQVDDSLLLAAARKPDFITKATLMGLFALHWHEADKLPRGMNARRNGGWLYMYSGRAIDQAISVVGGVEGWRRRIAERARRAGPADQEGRERPRIRACPYNPHTTPIQPPYNPHTPPLQLPRSDALRA
jgi:hypothetical protein